jgi:hypothetical protein
MKLAISPHPANPNRAEILSFSGLADIKGLWQ